MSNQNTVAGYYNIPTQTPGIQTEYALLVPATGTYPGTPSPLFQPQIVSGTSYQPGLSLGVPNDIAGSVWDGHKFVVRHTGRIVAASPCDVTFKMYSVPAANIGTVSATGSVTTAAAPGSGDVAMGGPALIADPGSGNYFVEYTLIWDSVSGKLNGFVFAQIANSAYVAPTAITQAAIASVSAMNFLPSVTFETAQVNTWTFDEFVIERQ